MDKNVTFFKMPMRLCFWEGCLFHKKSEILEKTMPNLMQYHFKKYCKG